MTSAPGGGGKHALVGGGRGVRRSETGCVMTVTIFLGLALVDLRHFCTEYL
jgi:hypothetical protein